jgi:putative transposase
MGRPTTARSIPGSGSVSYAIFDRDSTFSEEVVTFLDATGLKPKRTSVQAPWQNGVAERWIGSARRDCFDHVIALNEAHVRRLGREFIAYYHEDRTHLGLDKDTPSERPIEGKPEGPELESLARVGGLHHRYVWKAAA